jgi:hypothetical protein
VDPVQAAPKLLHPVPAEAHCCGCNPLHCNVVAAQVPHVPSPLLHAGVVPEHAVSPGAQFPSHVKFAQV